MDRMYQVMQHLRNLCTAFNTEYMRDFHNTADDELRNLKTAVNMAMTCGYSCQLWQDPFDGVFTLIAVMDNETGEMIKASVTGEYLNDWFITNHFKPTIERLPHWIEKSAYI